MEKLACLAMDSTTIIGQQKTVTRCYIYNDAIWVLQEKLEAGITAI
jgi:hypothetical protein